MSLEYRTTERWINEKLSVVLAVKPLSLLCSVRSMTLIDHNSAAPPEKQHCATSRDLDQPAHPHILHDQDQYYSLPDPIIVTEALSKKCVSWSDCMGAQADLDPYWLQTHTVVFFSWCRSISFASRTETALSWTGNILCSPTKHKSWGLQEADSVYWQNDKLLLKALVKYCIIPVGYTQQPGFLSRI